MEVEIVFDEATRRAFELDFDCNIKRSSFLDPCHIHLNAFPLSSAQSSCSICYFERRKFDNSYLARASASYWRWTCRQLCSDSSRKGGP
jgi:hypothetical protein